MACLGLGGALSLQPVQTGLSCPSLPSPHPCCPQVRSQALLFIKRMYEKEQLREYVEKFALNYLQLLVHPNPPSVLFGADKDTGGAQVHGAWPKHLLEPKPGPQEQPEMVSPGDKGLRLTYKGQAGPPQRPEPSPKPQPHPPTPTPEL